MPLIVNLDVMLARRKMQLTELSRRVGISLPNLSILKSGRARAIRFSTLEAICRELDCQPGDILEYDGDEPLPKKNTVDLLTCPVHHICFFMAPIPAYFAVSFTRL